VLQSQLEYKAISGRRCKKLPPHLSTGFVVIILFGIYSLYFYVQWASKVMTPASMYFLWKQGSWLLWPTVPQGCSDGFFAHPFAYANYFLKRPSEALGGHINWLMSASEQFYLNHLRRSLKVYYYHNIPSGNDKHSILDP